MPTSTAAEAARSESDLWRAIAQDWHRDRHQRVWADIPGAEAAVIPEVDPHGDLATRTRRWGYPIETGDLADLSRFAAALARTEEDAWQAGDRVVATRAFEERRFLLADRILPWAVPWLRAVGRCFPERRPEAERAVATLLVLGDRRRPAPQLTGAEGLYPPGYDGYGPAPGAGVLATRVASLWGGQVVFRRSLESMRGEPVPDRRSEESWWRDPGFRQSLVAWYEVAAVRWQRLAATHPGTARYWSELAIRSQTTAEIAK